VGGPSGLTVSAAGAVAWTPCEVKGPSTNGVVVKVSDNGVPALSATDADLPAQTLTFSLVGGPSGLTVSAAGVVAWTPSEAKGPSTNTVVVKVTDSAVPALTSSRSFNVIVREVNVAPVFVGLTNATIPELVLYQQKLTATDSDIPVQTLAVSLVSGPAGSGVTNGVFGWVPGQVPKPSTNEVKVAVTDGLVSTTNGFTLVVNKVSGPSVVKVGTGEASETGSPIAKAVVPVENTAPLISQFRISPADGTLGLALSGKDGATYRLEVTTDFIHWDLVEIIVLSGTSQEIDIPIPSSQKGRFYRVVAQ
ncbi:MAG TPA: hypothetical protein VMB21_05320, partial [Candidatus Limnocylindria bacterium]|nr:hypothetical protein [Candidatus Limnocylindria bacterium]